MSPIANWTALFEHKVGVLETSDPEATELGLRRGELGAAGGLRTTSVTGGEGFFALPSPRSQYGQCRPKPFARNTAICLLVNGASGQ